MELGRESHVTEIVGEHMSPSLAFATVSLEKMVLELRYEDAYIFWDRTGSVWERLLPEQSKPIFRTLGPTEHTDPSARSFEIEELYPTLDATSPLYSAMKLLDKCFEYIQRAMEAFDDEEYYESDSEVMYLMNTLPELFCFRSLGDGFANVISALQSSFINMGGVLLEKNQLKVIFESLEILRRSPFINFGSSMNIIESPKDSGLETEIAALDVLADLP